jgi:polyhydroxybutyrate depolymerase
MLLMNSSTPWRKRLWFVSALATVAAGGVWMATIAGVPTFFLPDARAAARPLERQVRVRGLDRSFLVYLPPGYQQKRALPVLLAFHGNSQAAEGLADVANIQSARLASNYLIVYPRGYRRSWNIDGICCGPAARANIDDVAFARTIIDDLASFVGIDRRRVYATGYSNGGAEAYHLGCAMSNVIAAIAPMSADMWDPKARCRPVRSVPVYTWHGLQDRFAPYDGGMTAAQGAPPAPSVQQNVEFWATVNGTKDIKRLSLFNGKADCDLYDGGRDNARVMSCRIAGMGHRWPGSRPTPGSMRGDAFFQNMGMSLGAYGPPIDVNDAMLEFFAAYALPEGG